MISLSRCLGVAATCLVLTNPATAWSMMVEHTVSSGVFSSEPQLTLSVPKFNPNAPEFADKQLESVELNFTLDIFVSIRANSTSELPSTTILQALVFADLAAPSGKKLLSLQTATDRDEGQVVLAGRNLNDNDNKNFFAGQVPTSALYDQVTLHQREGSVSTSASVAMEDLDEFIGEGNADLMAEFQRSFGITPISGAAASPSFDTSWTLNGSVAYSVVPIPGSVVLMASGLLALAAAVRRLKPAR